jgi:hypothetical protein
LPASQAPRSRASLTRSLVLALASLEVIRKTFAINGLARAAVNPAAIKESVGMNTNGRNCIFRVLNQIPTSNAWPASPRSAHTRIQPI